MALRALAAALALLLGLGQPVWAGPLARASVRPQPSGAGLGSVGAVGLPAPALGLTPAPLTAGLTPSGLSPVLAPAVPAAQDAPAAASAQLDAAALPAPAQARSADEQSAEGTRRWDAAAPARSSDEGVAAAPADGPAPSGLGPSLPSASAPSKGVPAPRVALARMAELGAWAGLTGLAALPYIGMDRIAPLVMSVIMGLMVGGVATFWVAMASQDSGWGRGEAPKERPVDQAEVNGASWRVGRFAEEAGLPKPKRFRVYPTDVINAQAGGGGRNDYEVNLHAGVLDLPAGARDAVIRHEVAHIKHSDVGWTVGGYVYAGVPATMALIAGVASDWAPLLAVPLLAGTLWLIGKSKQQAEYHADQYAAHKDGKPDHMVAALRAIQAQDAAPVPAPPKTRWHAAGRRAGAAWRRVSRVWAAHPPTAKRIERLERLAR